MNKNAMVEYLLNELKEEYNLWIMNKENNYSYMFMLCNDMGIIPPGFCGMPADPAPAAEMIETVLTVGLFDQHTCKQEISTPAARALLDEILLQRYGLYAYTMIECAGCYTMRAGQIVHEPSLRVEIVTESPIENLPGMIQDVKKALNQESIMCKVQKAQIAFA